MFKNTVTLDNYKINSAVLDALTRAGFITGFTVSKDKKTIEVELKYRDKYTPFIQKVRFYSKPGRRLYIRVSEITPVRSGEGVILISTPKGILTSYEAKKQNLGGEIICEIW